MRILYFTPHQIWPANTGARLRNFQLSRRLALRCSVALIEMRQLGEELHRLPDDSGVAQVFTLNRGRAYAPSKVLAGLVGPLPVTVLNCWSPRLAVELAEVLRSYQFDTVQIQGVHLMEYLPVIRKSPGNPDIVVDWHNTESELLGRYARTAGNWLKKIAAMRTAKLIRRAEDRLLDAGATHVVTSERERQQLLARRPDANVEVVPNGVDIDYYSPSAIAEACLHTVREESKRTILFVGSMDYRANIDAVSWFTRAVWPQIAREYADIQFTIVGRNPPHAISALASDRIRVTGTVDDVRPYYASATAVVVPLRFAGGTRLKILEAMAAGVPVVSTRLGAEGIEAEHNVHLLIVDTARELAAAVAQVVSSVETRSRLAAAARVLVSSRYDWSICSEQLYRIHYGLVMRRQSICAQMAL
jgi:polysaccharide biosynthesis protein PslH